MLNALSDAPYQEQVEFEPVDNLPPSFVTAAHELLLSLGLSPCEQDYGDFPRLQFWRPNGGCVAGTYYTVLFEDGTFVVEVTIRGVNVRADSKRSTVADLAVAVRALLEVPPCV